jgi:transcriptional regulator with XRE-family HTH domain
VSPDLYAAYWAGHFGEWLRRTMNARGVRRIDVIRRSGTSDTGRPIIDYSALGRWMSGDVLPTVGKLLVLADALAVPAETALAAAGYRYPLDAPSERQHGLSVLVNNEDEQSFLAAVLDAYRKECFRVGSQ